MKKLLIHTCCAPCFIYIEKELREKGLKVKEEYVPVDVTACFYNPNIHPKVEYERRKKTFIDFCAQVNCKNVVIDEYDLMGYARYVVENVGENKKYDTRCEYCYELRLRKVFEYAKEHQFDMVSTTLTISPYQNHELIQKVGKKLEEEFQISFQYIDEREHFREGQKMAREAGLYMQKYCGCMFSIDSGKWGY